MYFFRGFLEACVGDEGDGSVESFRLSENIKGERDTVTFELTIDTVEGILEGNPEIDLLGGRAVRGVSRHLCNGLNGLDP